MKIQFIGTGAADWDWSLPLADNVRGSTSTLLDGRLLIDAGPTALYQLQKQKIDPGKISDLFITHTHEDHFNVSVIESLAGVPRQGKLRVYASRQGLMQLSDAIEKIPLEYGRKTVAGNCRIMPLPANHMVPDVAENTHHLLIDAADGKRLLYALDGGWMTSVSRYLLRQDKIPVSMVIWDATCGNTFHDFRFADHNDLEMIRDMRLSMKKAMLINDDAVHVFNHIARTLWPEKAEDRLLLAQQYQGLLAEDGMSITL